MTETMLLDPVQVLVASDQPLQVGSAALFEDDRLIALGDEARERAAERGIAGQNRATNSWPHVSSTPTQAFPVHLQAAERRSKRSSTQQGEPVMGS